MRDYRIGPGDILNITVGGTTISAAVVAPDGRITFPLVGEVGAGGLGTTCARR